MPKNNKKFPPFKPAAYFGGNLLLGGLSYVLLRQYKRFFIFFGLILATLFIPISGWIIVLGSAFDAYIVANKLKEKKIPEPKYNKSLTWMAYGIWIIIISLNILLFFL